MAIRRPHPVAVVAWATPIAFEIWALATDREDFTFSAFARWAIRTDTRLGLAVSAAVLAWFSRHLLEDPERPGVRL